MSLSHWNVSQRRKVAGAAGEPISGQRIGSAEPREAAEAGVGGVDDGLVFDGEGGEMGVRGEVAGGAEVVEEAEEDFGMPGAWNEDADARTVKP